MATLGVNIDHVATVRQARGTRYPDPVDAAVLAQLAGADQITIHLREDRRHITDRDVRVLRDMLQVPMNLEMANTPEMIDIALKTKPHMVTLVPERREERTTEGGLAVQKYVNEIQLAVDKLQSNNIPVSLFIEASEADIQLSAKVKAKMIEIHTGRFAEFDDEPVKQAAELALLKRGCELAHSLGLVVHAGHGLNYRNARAVAVLPYMNDLNIGHSIVARAVLVGFERAVREMKDFIR